MGHQRIDLNAPRITESILAKYKSLIESMPVWGINIDDETAIEMYGISIDDVRFIIQLHRTHYGVSEISFQHTVHNVLPIDRLNELAEEELSPRVQATKDTRYGTFNFEYKTASGACRTGVYYVTCPTGDGLLVHRATSAKARFKCYTKQTIRFALGKSVSPIGKPVCLNDDAIPCNRKDALGLIEKDFEAFRAVYSGSNSSRLSAIEAQGEHTFAALAADYMSVLNEYDYDFLGEKLTKDLLSSMQNEIVNPTVRAMTNRCVDGRFELLDIETFDVIGYLDKRSNTRNIGIGKTVNVSKAGQFFQLHG